MSSGRWRASVEVPETAQALLGRVIAGKFEIESILGSGAMGVVFKARHVSLDVPVALKVLHGALAADERFSKRFRLEARIACSVAHANSVRVIDCGAEPDGTLYLAMEFVDGRDLFALLTQQGRLSPRRSAHIISQVLSALAAAHAAGIVHRDVKPENVLILLGEDDDGNPNEIAKVCDFGIASIVSAANGGRGARGSRLTQGVVVGTPAYMSPEQARGQSVDGRTDVYAVGVMLYQLLTGTLPFDADEPLALVLKHLNELPPAPEIVFPGVHAALAAVALTAMQKEPANRYESARAMRLAIRHAMGWSDHEAYSTRAPSGSPGAMEASGFLGRGRPTPLELLRTLTATHGFPHQAPTTPVSAVRPSPTALASAAPLEVRAGPRSEPSLPPRPLHRRGRVVGAGIAVALLLGGWALTQRSGQAAGARSGPSVTKPTSSAESSPASKEVARSTSFARPAEVVGETPSAPEAPRAPVADTSSPLPVAPTAPMPAKPRAREPDVSSPGPMVANERVLGPSPSLAPAPPLIASPVVPARSAVVSPEPPPAVTRSAAAARVAVLGISGERGVTPRSVAAGIAGILPRIVDCYRSALSAPAAEASGAGTGTLHLETDGDGVVTSAVSRLPVPALASRCIERVAIGVQLAGVDTGEATADVSLSFHAE